jgi:anti-anti-sigma factor
MSTEPLTTTETTDNALVVRVHVERIDDENFEPFQAAIADAGKAAGRKPLIVDMSKVEFMPSLSLAALVRLSTQFRGRQQRFVLTGLQPELREVFRMMHLHQIIEVHGTVEAAQRAVRPI